MPRLALVRWIATALLLGLAACAGPHEPSTLPQPSAALPVDVTTEQQTVELRPVTWRGDPIDVELRGEHVDDSGRWTSIEPVAGRTFVPRVPGLARLAARGRAPRFVALTGDTLKSTRIDVVLVEAEVAELEFTGSREGLDAPIVFELVPNLSNEDDDWLAAFGADAEAAFDPRATEVDRRARVARVLNDGHDHVAPHARCDLVRAVPERTFELFPGDERLRVEISSDPQHEWHAPFESVCFDDGMVFDGRAQSPYFGTISESNLIRARRVQTALVTAAIELKPRPARANTRMRLREGGVDSGELLSVEVVRDADENVERVEVQYLVRELGPQVLELRIWEHDPPRFIYVEREIDVVPNARIDLGVVEPLPTRLEFVPRVVDELGVEHALLDMIEFEETRLAVELAPLGDVTTWLTFDPRRTCTVVGIPNGEYTAQLAMDRHWRTRPARGWRFDFERGPTRFHCDGDDVVAIEVPIAPTGYGRARASVEKFGRLVPGDALTGRLGDVHLFSIGPTGRRGWFHAPVLAEADALILLGNEFEFGTNRIVGRLVVRGEGDERRNVLVDQLVEVRPREEFVLDLVPRNGATLVGRTTISPFVEAVLDDLPGTPGNRAIEPDLSMRLLATRVSESPKTYEWSFSGLLPDTDYEISIGNSGPTSFVFRTGAEGTTVDVGLVE